MARAAGTSATTCMSSTRPFVTKARASSSPLALRPGFPKVHERPDAQLDLLHPSLRSFISEGCREGEGCLQHHGPGAVTPRAESWPPRGRDATSISPLRGLAGTTSKRATGSARVNGERSSARSPRGTTGAATDAARQRVTRRMTSRSSSTTSLRSSKADRLETSTTSDCSALRATRSRARPKRLAPMRPGSTADELRRTDRENCMLLTSESSPAPGVGGSESLKKFPGAPAPSVKNTAAQIGR